MVKLKVTLITLIIFLFRNIGGISSELIDFKGISSIPRLKYIVFDKFHYCFIKELHVDVCRPKTDGKLETKFHSDSF
jgi:hypothetical protein